MTHSWTAWPAPAKLNLCLRIIGRREDGYHRLQTVFRLLDWGDQVHLRPRDDARIERVAGAEGVAVEDDLTVRAARLLQAHSACPLGADIAVDKRIPMGGGLGGGSSNAASVLVGLNRLWRTGLSADALAELGVTLGADVPVFVRGHTAWAEGVGEILSPLELPECWYVIVDPRVAVPTAPLFQAPELTRNAPEATISDFLSGHMAENAFEPVVRARFPVVSAALDWLGCFGTARLSGSGACVFVELTTRAEAQAAAARCPEQFSAYVARGVNASALLAAAEKV
ncbi:4-(cytidine 5'-diphospho)-2-C-methyl-D-erythritol kinase [Oleiagrimonas sp. C23AA]|uniref:4-(cytidine 5'-diphospho)-2-C-methyl-D-erythritol kinase n=1 Tax=Oleiagrimonas sp. C23AA TaxID=2719047 RepID=UPI0014246503|nr:4-(cytidine 5'-diphospho)-2-C-methyl-D-erythritol kinase [Oleiagrimonas sp. C23AA]NII11588.1 4-(cytidine 5'-diphospho)-2-C-methyl-D-erythritol kinase [Oleiagrimonas sp. C23AA]